MVVQLSVENERALVLNDAGTSERRRTSIIDIKDGFTVAVLLKNKVT